MAGVTQNADGSIVIDTRIDAAGLNKGTKQIEKAAATASKPWQGLSKSLGGVLSIVGKIAGVLAAAFIGGSIINGIRGIVQEFDLLTGSSGSKFKELSGALETLKGAFVNLIVQAFVPIIPYIVDFVHWLTTAFQTVTQIIAALFGFEKTVGGIMTKAASGAQKAAKAAKGALAAFDQINVLQKQQEPATPETGATATPEALTIADDILKKVADLKALWDAFLKDPLGVLVAALTVAIGILQEKWRQFVEWVRDNLPFGDVIANILTIIGDTVKRLFVNFIETVLKIKENVLLVFQGIKEFITGVFTGDWALAWEGLKNIVTGVFGALAAIVEGALNHIGILLDEMVRVLQVLFAPVIEWLAEAFDRIKAKITEAIQGVMTTFGNLAKWFLENVWLPVENGFGSMLTGIKQGFETTFNGIKTFIKGVMNSIIDFINGMIEGIVFGINSVIGAANAVGEIVGLPEIGYIDAPKIPRLATGAVIPPNSEFLAVLGDQKSGTNIEAPEGLIRQIIREEIGALGGETVIPITLTLDGETVYRNQQRVGKRHGKNLIASGITR